MYRYSGKALPGAMAILLVLALVSLGQMKETMKRKRTDDAARHAREAAEVLEEIMGVKEKSIPKELLEKAEAVAVFPGVVKAAFVFGGRGGQGVISRHTPQGWSEPAFFNIGGGSFGAQIGVQKTDYVLLIMNDGGLKGLLEDKFEFGGEVGIAAGPVGRTASAGTNATLDAGILSYSRSKGVFAGASLKGAVISPDNDLNKAFYGKTAKDLLTESGMAMNMIPTEVRIFPDTLKQYTPQTHHTFTSGSANAQAVEANPGLIREIRHELLLLPYYNVFDWITFEVQPDRTVILRGYVTAPPDTKSAAESAVKGVDGVKRVVNEIEVLPVSPNDERLRMALYRAIYSGPLFRYAVGSLNTIHIIVKNGHATLEGEVSSTGDKHLAYLQASKVSGVFSLKNNLKARSELPG